MSVVDGKLCTEYRDNRMKRKMVREGWLRDISHCPGFMKEGACRCGPCVICNRRIPSRGPQLSPVLRGPNGMWIGSHCFVCFQKQRPLFAAVYGDWAGQHVRSGA